MRGADHTRLGSKARVRLRQGDRLIIETSGGGGWGAPLERDPAAVAADVAEGLITPDRARGLRRRHRAGRRRR